MDADTTDQGTPDVEITGEHSRAAPASQAHSLMGAQQQAGMGLPLQQFLQQQQALQLQLQQQQQALQHHFPQGVTR
jgi:hypothetical protein